MSTAITAARMQVVADLLARLPADLPAPCVWSFDHGKVDVNWQILHDDPATQLATMNTIRRAVGGQWNKGPWGERFDLEQRPTDWLLLSIYAKRDAVCTRRVVGTESVTVPAVEASPERVEEREVVEWDCAPLLADEPADEPVAS